MKHIRDCLLTLTNAVNIATDIKPYQRELLYRLIHAISLIVHEDWIATMYMQTIVGKVVNEPKD